MSAQTIQDQVAITYQNNLAYLEQSHPDLFHKVVSLDFAIDAGHYTEQYALEYMDEGYFDVKGVQTGRYLYGEDSVGYAMSIMPDAQTLAKSQKAIFYGLGLGTHVSLICEAIENPVSFMIVEDDLELFRLSLFVMDFSTISKQTTFHFAVMEENDTFKNIFTTFYEVEKSHNDFIPYYMFSAYYTTKMEVVKKFIEDLK